jgi:hypothetical protein
MAFHYSPKIVTDGLILCLDAANTKSFVVGSATWSDLSLSRLSGSLINGPTFNSENCGSIVFDGIDDRIDISPIDFNLTDLSINTWVNSNDTTINYSRIIQKSDTTSTTKGFLIVNSNIDGKLVFVYQPTYSTSEILKRSTTIMSNNIWYHISMTYNSINGLKIYFNGVEDLGEISTSPDVAWTSNTGNLFSIGARTGGFTNGIGYQAFNGRISQTFIYNRVLSPTEILQNFNASKSRFGL